MDAILVLGIITGLILVRFLCYPFWKLATRVLEDRYGLRVPLIGSLAISGLILAWFFFGHHIPLSDQLYDYLSGAVTDWAGKNPFALWFVFSTLTIAIVLSVGAPLWTLIALAGSLSSDSHGSARYMSRAQVARTSGPLQLGSWRGSKVRYRTQKHVLTIAPTGAGKGIGCVVPTLLDYPGSVVVLDPKGEAWAVTHRHRETLGPVHVIDPWGQTGAPSPAGVDLLASLDTSSPDCISKAKVITDALVIRSTERDGFWDDSAQSLLQGILLHLAHQPAARQSADQLRRIVMDEKGLLEVTLQDMVADDTAAFGNPGRAASAFSARADRERSSVLSTAQRHTEFLEDPRLAEALSRDDIRWGTLKDQPQTVYLVIPPAQLRAQSRFVRVLLALAMAELTAGGPGSTEVLLLLDEVAQLGHFAALEDAIAIVRGYGVRVWALVQDLSQLKAVYPKWETFLANTTLQAFGTQDQFTAKHLSDMLGNQTIMVESNQSSLQPGKILKAEGKNRAPTSRPLLTPDEIRALPESSVLVFEQSKRPAWVRRLSYVKDPTLRGRWDENPMYAGGR